MGEEKPDPVDHDLVLVDEFDALAIELSHKEQKYPAKQHARKVVKELGAKHGIIYIPGQTSMTWEDSDMGPPFRQRRYFYYLSGLKVPGCAVTYDVLKDKLILWVPYTPASMVLWFGATPSPEEVLKKTEVDDVRYITDLEKYFITAVYAAKTLFVLSEALLPKLRSLGEVIPYITVDTSSLKLAVDEARVIKSDYEVAMIRKANDISSSAHKLVAEKLKNFKNECEVEATFAAACTAHRAGAQAYPIIAGSGPNAGTLHYDANNQPLTGRQHLVLDAGAEWECYASDITRTLPISGKFTKEGKAIYDIVDRMQKECIARIKPGNLFYSMHLHAHIVAVKGLLQLGILHNGSVKDIFANGTSAAFFPHGLGHHVGLEVHDVQGKERLLLPASFHKRGMRRTLVTAEFLRSMISQVATEDISAATAPAPPYKGRRLMAPNMVITVEPGIYFNKAYIEAYFLSKEEHAKYINAKVLERYYDVGGVRIEDCLLVTESGSENLSSAPKGEEMLRIMNAV